MIREGPLDAARSASDTRFRKGRRDVVGQSMGVKDAPGRRGAACSPGHSAAEELSCFHP